MACVLAERQRDINRVLAEYKEQEAQEEDLDSDFAAGIDPFGELDE